MQTSIARRRIEESMSTGACRILDQHDIVSRAELIELVRAAQGGETEHVTRVIHAMSRLAFKHASYYWLRWAPSLPPTASFCDVFSEVLLGVVKSIEPFDCDSGYAFTTYAGWKIRAAAQLAIYDAIGGGSVSHYGVHSNDQRGSLMRATQVLSADRVTTGSGSGIDERETILTREIDSRVEPFETGLQETDMLTLLSSIDPKLPEMLELLDRPYTPREVGRLVGKKTKDVIELVECAGWRLHAAGLTELTPA